MIDIEAKEFFFVGADVVPSEAFNNVAKRPKINALCTMRVEAPGDRTEGLATLLDGGGQNVSASAQGSTSNQYYSSKGSRCVSQNGLPGLGTSTKRNLLELTKRDERVNIAHHVTMFIVQGSGEQRLLRKPSPDNRVVQLLPARDSR